MITFPQLADSIIRGRPAVVSVGGARTLISLLGCLCLFSILYGAAMGSFGGIEGDRFWQVIYSAAKVPLLLSATFLISLPSFFVINTLFGLRDDLAVALRCLIATQAGLAIVLASLAPLTLLWYASSAHYGAAILANAAAFATASLAAQRLLWGYYRPLIARNRKHRWQLWGWIVVYAFVGIQMGWVLRPFIGNPHEAVQFFREESWGNAYVIVGRLIWNVLGFL